MVLLVSVLATWRICHMLAYEDGPVALIFRLRDRLGVGLLGELMDCVACSSVWVSLILVIPLHFQGWVRLPFFSCWFAVSAGAILVEALHALLRKKAQ